MASSRVMASSSMGGSDLTRLQNSAAGDPSKTIGSMSVDDLLRNIYGEGASAPSPVPGGKTMEDVWREVSTGRKQEGGEGIEEMTLEDFLARTGAVMEEEVRDPSGPRIETGMGLENRILGFGTVADGGGTGGRGRGRKRLLMDPEDRVALQRQKRMIKNRESAARSRERKQAYTAELETLVMQLEEENVTLLTEREEERKERINQLMKNIIPVTEGRKPRRPLRRTRSMQW
ncbi:bZIP transcription factor 12-like isoform X1 [Dioscorea cayenensis subsp. rotundata]|uniref:BZIP transcription factor 12-like isoform X1 n=1 Tax=Dioscorea cayennensis subsp. rotundata TaxID=55577 RepID=A0AB40B6W8_DIOCR|nr:bZIP transcription factor 12-like isoform X1 [Dioscorea cayenensis subsp. rotundata]